MYDDESPKPKNFRFSPEEDQHLRSLVLEQKLNNWVKIASLMTGRNVHQCRERWRQIVCKRGPGNEWMPEEDEIVMSRYNDLGRRWSQIQTSVPNHSIPQIKARISFLQKKNSSNYIPAKAKSKKQSKKESNNPPAVETLQSPLIPVHEEPPILPTPVEIIQNNTDPKEPDPFNSIFTEISTTQQGDFNFGWLESSNDHCDSIFDTDF